MKNRSLLRRQAKQIYKKQSKGVPKAKRMPFSQFFQNYIKSKKQEAEVIPETNGEDFDFGDAVNFNNISDEDDTPEDNADNEQKE